MVSSLDTLCRYEHYVSSPEIICLLPEIGFTVCQVASNPRVAEVGVTSVELMAVDFPLSERKEAGSAVLTLVRDSIEQRRVRTD